MIQNDIINKWQKVDKNDVHFRAIYVFYVNDKIFYLKVAAQWLPQYERYPGCIWSKVIHVADNGEQYSFDVKKQVRKYIKERSIDGLARAFEDLVENEATYFYSEVLRDENSREYIENWEDLHVEMYSREQEERDIPWEKVAEYGSQTMRRYRLLETCPGCNSQLIQVYVPRVDPDGRIQSHYWLKFCPECQIQLDYKFEYLELQL